MTDSSIKCIFKLELAGVLGALLGFALHKQLDFYLAFTAVLTWAFLLSFAVGLLWTLVIRPRLGSGRFISAALAMLCFLLCFALGAVSIRYTPETLFEQEFAITPAPPVRVEHAQIIPHGAAYHILMKFHAPAAIIDRIKTNINLQPARRLFKPSEIEQASDDLASELRQTELDQFFLNIRDLKLPDWWTPSRRIDYQLLVILHSRCLAWDEHTGTVYYQRRSLSAEEIYRSQKTSSKSEVTP